MPVVCTWGESGADVTALVYGEAASSDDVDVWMLFAVSWFGAVDALLFVFYGCGVVFVLFVFSVVVLVVLSFVFSIFVLGVCHDSAIGFDDDVPCVCADVVSVNGPEPVGGLVSVRDGL